MAAGFDVFLTVDKNLPKQQKLTAYAIAVVVLRCATNDIDDLRKLVPEVMKKLSATKKGKGVGCGVGAARRDAGPPRRGGRRRATSHNGPPASGDPTGPLGAMAPTKNGAPGGRALPYFKERSLTFTSLMAHF